MSPNPLDLAPVLVFDGDCGFCTTSATLANRRLGVTIAPWQQVDLDAFGLTSDECQQAVQWVNVDGSTASGAAAVAAALRSGPWWGRPFGVVLDAPGLRTVAAAVYRLIARYRYKLPGATAACRLDAHPRVVPGSRGVGEADRR